jgi:glutathione S-transferase
LASAYGIDLELVNIGNVGDASPKAFGPNPLMKVPTLIHGSKVVFESDHIASYLTLSYHPQDTFDVLQPELPALNSRAVMNGIMSSQVELVLAQRGGIDIEVQPRFQKLKASIAQSLQWLDNNANAFREAPTYAGFHLVCMWDLLKLYETLPLENLPRLEQVHSRISVLPYVSESAPAGPFLFPK